MKERNQHFLSSAFGQHVIVPTSITETIGEEGIWGENQNKKNQKDLLIEKEEVEDLTSTRILELKKHVRHYLFSYLV